MKKEIRKSIQTELTELIKNALAIKNAAAAAKVMKNIRKYSKEIARKFSKNIPSEVKVKKVRTKRKMKELKKVDKGRKTKSSAKRVEKPGKKNG